MEDMFQTWIQVYESAYQSNVSVLGEFDVRIQINTLHKHFIKHLVGNNLWPKFKNNNQECLIPKNHKTTTHHPLPKPFCQFDASGTN